MPRLKGQNCRHGGACRYPICIPLPLPKLHPETATASHQSESKTEDNARLYNRTCRPGSRITSGTTVFRGKYPLTLRSAASRRGSPLEERTYSTSFETALSRLLRMRMGPPIPVIPAQAGIQSHKHKSSLPPWTPVQVRGDDVSDKHALTLRSAASRRGSPLQAPHLQPLLRDGATAPPQDENGTI